MNGSDILNQLTGMHKKSRNKSNSCSGSMLEATFHGLVRGISADREARLWAQGITSWNDLEKSLRVQGQLFDQLDEDAGESKFGLIRKAFQNEDASYFSQALDSREQYRIALAYPHRTVFLDIETTGLSRYYDHITLVGWSYKDRYNVFVQGQSDEAFRKVLQDAAAIVTFNGSLFDLPFLREAYPDIVTPPAHIDLRFLAKRVDLSGGQKAVEELLGFRRPEDIQQVKGETAPLLWHRYRRGSLDALKLLIEYNHWDIEGMKFIFDHVVARLVAERGAPPSLRRHLPRFSPSARDSRSQRMGSTRDKVRRLKLQPYEGRTGPAVTLDGLGLKRGTDPLRVVGIDLTGSEARPSGWCLLAGSDAVTRVLGSDDKLVADTIAARPHLVSIDSPLSLPYGRLAVSDDDPGRDEYGIMRHCERVLKRRGINVYPALIPSMQKLTARGIALASRFRSLGLPVIESYPGAAQDIMGIPRKRASLDMLCEGLAEFGVRGAYQTEQLTHDELDAITAAVVGVFFWSGKFESLGSEDEEALIIPDLKADAQSWRDRVVFGISGPIAAGKTTAAHYLESLGFTYTRYSMVLEQMLKLEGMETGRDALQEYGDRVHRERGQRWLGRKLLASLPKVGNAVIDGLRFPDDHSFLAEVVGPGFRHIYVDAPEELRKSRFESRQGSLASFAHAQAHPVEQKVGAMRDLAHRVVINEGSPDGLNSQLAKLISENIAEG